MMRDWAIILYFKIIVTNNNIGNHSLIFINFQGFMETNFGH